VSVTVQTTGFRELEAALAELGKVATQKAAARRALIKAAEPVASMAEALAPRDTGGLAISIGIGTQLTKRQAALHRRMFRSDRAAVEVFVGAGGLAQATQMEFGNVKDAPQPFMRPAWDAEGRATLDRLAALMWTEIEKTAARQARRAARQAAKG
jgi:HK97 gp10 family phage protein